MDLWAYSGYQFGLIMLIVGIVSGSMMGWGFHKIWLKRHD